MNFLMRFTHLKSLETMTYSNIVRVCGFPARKVSDIHFLNCLARSRVRYKIHVCLELSVRVTFLLQTLTSVMKQVWKHLSSLVAFMLSIIKNFRLSVKTAREKCK